MKSLFKTWLLALLAVTLPPKNYTEFISFQSSDQQKLQERLSRRIFLQPTHEAAANAAIATLNTAVFAKSTPAKAGENL